MAKRFGELSSIPELKPSTKAVKGTTGIMEALGVRAKVLSIVEKAFSQLGKTKSAPYHKILSDIFDGKEVTKQDLNDILGILDTSFSLGSKVDTRITESLYKRLRKDLTPDQLKKLQSGRGFLDKWYKDSNKTSQIDLDNFDPAEMEALAFADYLNGVFNPSVKDFDNSTHKKVFKGFENALKRIKKELGDIGFAKTDDLLMFNRESFEKVAPEAQRPEVFSNRVQDSILDETLQQEVLELSNRVTENAAEANFTSPPKGPKYPKGTDGSGDKEDFPNNQGGFGWKFMSYWTSVPHMARHIPLISRPYNNQLKTRLRSSEFQTRNANKYSQFQDEFGPNALRRSIKDY